MARAPTPQGPQERASLGGQWRPRDTLLAAGAAIYGQLWGLPSTQSLVQERTQDAGNTEEAPEVPAPHGPQQGISGPQPTVLGRSRLGHLHFLSKQDTVLQRRNIGNMLSGGGVPSCAQRTPVGPQPPSIPSLNPSGETDGSLPSSHGAGTTLLARVSTHPPTGPPSAADTSPAGAPQTVHVTVVPSDGPAVAGTGTKRRTRRRFFTVCSVTHPLTPAEGTRTGEKGDTAIAVRFTREGRRRAGVLGNHARTSTPEALTPRTTAPTPAMMP